MATLQQGSMIGGFISRQFFGVITVGPPQSGGQHDSDFLDAIPLKLKFLVGMKKKRYCKTKISYTLTLMSMVILQINIVIR